MCGIIGISWDDRKTLKNGLEVIMHRGPDDSGVEVNNVSLGNCRLAVMDLSEKGHMPMTRKGRTITFNGEIYNFKEIRKKLKGYRFQSDSDTEVILHAYDKWGPKCLEKFNGMFAFCIYDSRKKELFLARDRFGIKPLYYMKGERGIAFCSELKGILGLLKEKKVDKEGLKQFFTFRFTLGETTLVDRVKKFLPCHYMTYNLEERKVKNYKKYYELKPRLEKKSMEEWKKDARKAVEKAVERRMVADVPVACLLSGGLDSTIIATLAKKHNPDLNTFSIGFDTTNELPYAKTVAEHLGANHHEITMDKDNVLDYLDEVVWHMDEPIGDPAFLPIYVLSQEVRKHNKVVLSGDGTDEVFCGYDRYKMYHYGRFLRNFALADFNHPFLKRLKAMRGKDDYNAFLEVIRLFQREELEKLEVEEYDASSFWTDYYDEALTNAQLFDIQTLLPNDFFMKADKMSSAFGLEQRVPFMDHELIEIAFSMPRKHKLKGWDEKHVLKEAFKGIIPKQVLERRKFAFHVPIDYWFRNVLGDKLRELLEESEHGLYEKSYIIKVLDSMKTESGNYKVAFLKAQKLWSVLMFEMWYRKFMK